MWYYYTEIKEMMRISKETGESVISIFNDETIFIKYYEQFDDYTFQYSWIITDDSSNIEKKVQNDLSEFSLSKFGHAQITPNTLDVIQVGLVSAYDTSADYFLQIIKHAKKKKLEQTRDTKYVFFGKKVLSVIQYYGIFSNPFECLDNISSWSHQDFRQEIEDKQLIKIARGIFCVYSEENDSVIFSIGCKYIKTVFGDKISKTIPPLLCIDSIKGITEYNISDYVK